MDRVGPGTAFVSGQGGEVGRRLLKARHDGARLAPAQRRAAASSSADHALADRRPALRPSDSRLSCSELASRRCSRAGERQYASVSSGRAISTPSIASTCTPPTPSSGRDVRGWPWRRSRCRSRAPFHTQRWLDAVLVGRPVGARRRRRQAAAHRASRRRAAAASRRASRDLSLPASARVSRPCGGRPGRGVASDHGRLTRRARAAPGRRQGRGRGLRGAGRRARERRRAGRSGRRRSAERLAHRLHARVDSREAWLRTESWGFVEEILGGDPLAERGIVERGAYRACSSAAGPVRTSHGLSACCWDSSSGTASSSTATARRSRAARREAAGLRAQRLVDVGEPGVLHARRGARAYAGDARRGRARTGRRFVRSPRRLGDRPQNGTSRSPRWRRTWRPCASRRRCACPSPGTPAGVSTRSSPVPDCAVV